ncbi:MAG TPA: thiamine phosphate synthase [Nitrospirae bacterium]|nr:thiamine-phosphate synthase [bacterium BMS3Bbin09]HDH34372.1 thiamine phosphate synthase [Nitrospirota bacterium]HDO67042.1 thiamine phosphate synthase [Nitrospirota bacterium]HDZ84656.1 thiamine phosphate synthase [Nitrospirota bacterium]HEW81216.1 thiamine phosphate synthase [Nitrospirota bacterium]
MIFKKLITKTVLLYLLTDAHTGLTHVQITRQALSSGIRIIQLREKCVPKKDIYKEALAMRALTAKQRAALIINDHIDIALAVDADGVHLGQEDMPLIEARRIMGRKKIIGISTHTLGQAQKAEAEGADYIGFGPVFHTNTKDAGKPKGLKALQKVRAHIKIPIVAIGGITSSNIREVLMSGADAAAIASGILSGSIKANTKEYLASLE